MRIEYFPTISCFRKQITTFGSILFLSLFFACPAKVDAEKVSGIVLDVNGIPISGAKLCPHAHFVFNIPENKLHYTKQTEIVARTDTNGVFDVDFPEKGPGVLFFVANDSLTKMGVFRKFRRDREENYTVALAAPARIEATFETKSAAFSVFTVQLQYKEIIATGRERYFDFITIDYILEEALDSISMDIPCPSDCKLELKIMKGFSRNYNVEIPSLKPGEIFNLGTQFLKPGGIQSLIDNEPPDLQIAEWVKGEPITLEALKGKLVLLDFWGLWCNPCIEKFPELIRLHKKYSKDGLIIIGIHDSSKTKQDLVSCDSARFDISKIPFRIAIDSPSLKFPSGASGQGKTIEKFGITSFPTMVLLGQDGLIKGTEKDNIEDNIKQLLHIKDKAGGWKIVGQCKEDSLTIIITMCGLLFVGIYCLFRFYSMMKH